MKTKTLAAAALALATAVQAAPPSAFGPALKSEIGGVSEQVFKGIRNKAYSLEALRRHVQANLTRAQERLARRQLAANVAGLRERVLEETGDFLKELGPEVDRLAAESRSGSELAERLETIRPFAASPAAAPRAGALRPTEENIEGPFYRPDAPWSDAVAPAGAAGTRIRLSGRVLDVNGAPIPNAVVDVWQSDAEGAYDIDDPADRRNPRIPYRFRARRRALRDGRYAFTTILPGQYEIGEGKWRPKHIHFKVSAPGFALVTTQLYFEGDEYNAVDPWWKASTTIPLAGDAGSFDFVLAGR
ncbi:MAG: hypothetical protein HY553_11250 [Elusimicrobia bacterium]|nr:hypothetical protein [Elusimicrobiota bacterium]